MSKALIKTLSLIATFFALGASAQDKPTQLDYTLGAGDIIRVQVFQNPELTIDTRVSENGSITYPLIESIQIGGLSIGNAEQKIGQALRDGDFVRKPQVNIVLLQIRGNQISVLGQVNRPGRFPLETFNTRVTDMLAAAGGTSAIGDDVAILSGLRNGIPFQQKIDIPALYLDDSKETNTLLAGGDSIYVHRAPVYYIYGEAQRSGSYRIERGMTVMQALAQSGGPTARGSEYRLRLHRKAANGEIEKTSPEMSDVIQPNDVIYVRESIF
jgi:polysaccharide export outer membrane protein